MQSRPFSVEAPAGRRLDGLIDLPDGGGKHPTIVVCHGFKGFMEWGFFPHLARLLVERGFAVVRFNFSGTGMRPGDDEVTSPDAFRRATIGRDLEDLAALLDALGVSIAAGEIESGRLGLLGHSRGGGAAILAAAGDQRVKTIVTWAAVATFDRVSDGEKELWREDGELPIVNARTGQRLSMGIELLEDLEQNPTAYDLQAAAAAVLAPWLIVHGSADETVAASEARDLAAAATAPHELHLIEDAGHTLGAQHPFVGPTPHLIQAMNATQTWFRRHLGGR